MKKLSLLLSIIILTFIPSVLIYTFFDVYIRLNPFYINIITGSLPFATSNPPSRNNNDPVIILM